MSPASALKGLPEAWRTWRVVAAILVAGFGIGFTLSGWAPLRAEVTRQGDAIADIQDQISRMQRTDSVRAADIRRIKCLVEAVALKDDPIARCGLVDERRLPLRRN